VAGRPHNAHFHALSFVNHPRHINRCRLALAHSLLISVVTFCSFQLSWKRHARENGVRNLLTFTAVPSHPPSPVQPTRAPLQHAQGLQSSCFRFTNRFLQVLAPGVKFVSRCLGLFVVVIAGLMQAG
jgi:hypothetical protein